MWYPILPVRQSPSGGISLWVAVFLFSLTAGTVLSGEPERRVVPHAESLGLPRIGCSDSVLHFQAQRLGHIPPSQTIQIYNESDVGMLQWDIFADRGWLSASPSNAIGNETDVAIWIVNTDAPLGHHSGHLVISSDNAVNEPETVWVELDMLCPVPITGDANADGRLSQADIIYLVNHVLKGGPPPNPVWQAGDTNCDRALSQSDIVLLVNHLLRGGPSPCNVCQFF